MPLPRFPAAVLTRLALYLLFFTWALRLYAGSDYLVTRHYFNVLDPIGFALAACWWVHIAWRHENQNDRIYVNTLRTLERGAY